MPGKAPVCTSTRPPGKAPSKRGPATVYSIGFTGSRYGMTDIQRAVLRDFLINEYLDAEEDGETDLWFRHGDCIGADAEAHDMAFRLGYEIAIFPPSENKYRAFKKQYTTIDSCRSYHERNRVIVDGCDILVGCPRSITDQKGGTWYTIRYCKHLSRRLVVIQPDGKFGKCSSISI